MSLFDGTTAILGILALGCFYEGWLECGRLAGYRKIPPAVIVPRHYVWSTWLQGALFGAGAALFISLLIGSF